jgi:site-specific DNA-methyltransferase (adenine-specific)
MKEYDDLYFDVAFADCPQKWKGNTEVLNRFFPLFKSVSKVQLVFGYQFYKDYLDGGSFIVWDKGELITQSGMDEANLIWISERVASRIIHFDMQFAEKRIHQAEKPYQVYMWILRHFPEKHLRILDCHTGSGSLRRAAALLGHDYVGYEVDRETWEKQEEIFQSLKGE